MSAGDNRATPLSPLPHSATELQHGVDALLAQPVAAMQSSSCSEGVRFFIASPSCTMEQNSSKQKR